MHITGQVSLKRHSSRAPCFATWGFLARPRCWCHSGDTKTRQGRRAPFVGRSPCAPGACVYSVYIAIYTVAAGTPSATGRQHYDKADYLDIVVSNASAKPIYQQVADQLKAAILAGELAPGEALPSIRGLANDLRVSVITTKRAYQELEAEALIDTVPGRGSFVAQAAEGLLTEERNRRLEELLQAALDYGREAGFSDGEVRERLELLAEADD